MNIYLICPVRGATEEEKNFLDQEVCRMESSGHKVHYPPRDVDQTDPNGIRIVMAHKNAMKESHLVRLFYRNKSHGSCFDLGMAIMAQRPLQSMGELEDDPFDYMAMLAAEYSGRRHGISNYFNCIMKRKDQITDSGFITYSGWDSTNPFMLLDLGMVVMSGTPLFLKKGHSVQCTEEKSFDNVVLALDRIYRGLPPSH